MGRLRTPLLGAPPLPRYGVPELVLGTSPSVATDFTQTVLGGFYARLISVFCRLVCDANVASREVVLEYRDQQNNRFDLTGSGTTVAAASTTDYAFSAYQGPTGITADATLLIPLHPILLAPSWNFRLHIVNVQAGDQLSRVRFYWERFYSDFAQPGSDPSDF